MLHCEGKIELIKHRFFSMNNKFQAIVDNLKVPVCNDYLFVKRSAPLVKPLVATQAPVALTAISRILSVL